MTNTNDAGKDLYIRSKLTKFEKLRLNLIWAPPIILCISILIMMIFPDTSQYDRLAVIGFIVSALISVPLRISMTPRLQQLANEYDNLPKK